MGRSRVCLFVIVCSAVVVAKSSADPVLVYTGPDQLAFGPGNLPTNTFPYADVDLFTLGSDSVVTQIDWSAWVNPGTQPTTIDWAITTNLVSGCCGLTGLSDVVASGTANPTNTLTATNVARDHSDVYWSMFNVNVPLMAGTYYLWIGDVGPSGATAGWGYTSNTGGDSQQFRNGISTFVGNGRYSFELDGTTTGAPAVPEPASLALLGLGLVGGAVRRRRRQSSGV